MIVGDIRSNYWNCCNMIISSSLGTVIASDYSRERSANLKATSAKSMYPLSELTYVVANLTERFRYSQAHRSARFPEPEQREVIGTEEIGSAEKDTETTARSRINSWHHSRLTCPRCSKSNVTRAAREGLKEKVLSSVYVYPFECRSCRHRFRMLEWGTRYRRIRREKWFDK
jgi:hypothetical protein